MNTVFGVMMMLACLVMQVLIAAASMRYYERSQGLVDQGSFLASLLVIGTALVILLVGNLSQIMMWALLFEFLGEFENFGTAMYHSAVNFATLGYGDIVMSDEHRMLGPLEAINGVLMIGVSTAVLMAVMQDAMQRQLGNRSS